MAEKITAAHIIDNWVVCPYCFAKQFPVDGTESIVNLKYRCRKSTATSEHFMMINVKKLKNN